MTSVTSVSVVRVTCAMVCKLCTMRVAMVWRMPRGASSALFVPSVEAGRQQPFPHLGSGFCPGSAAMHLVEVYPMLLCHPAGDRRHLDWTPPPVLAGSNFEPQERAAHLPAGFYHSGLSPGPATGQYPSPEPYGGPLVRLEAPLDSQAPAIAGWVVRVVAGSK